MHRVPVKVSDDSGFAEGYSAEIHLQVSIMLNNKKSWCNIFVSVFSLDTSNDTTLFRLFHEPNGTKNVLISCFVTTCVCCTRGVRFVIGRSQSSRALHRPYGLVLAIGICLPHLFIVLEYWRNSTSYTLIYHPLYLAFHNPPRQGGVNASYSLAPAYDYITASDGYDIAALHHQCILTLYFPPVYSCGYTLRFVSYSVVIISQPRLALDI